MPTVNPLTTTDVLGHTSTTLYDVMGRLTGTIDPLGNQTTATYDVSGLELTTTDALGVQSSAVYDGFARGQWSSPSEQWVRRAKVRR